MVGGGEIRDVRPNLGRPGAARVSLSVEPRVEPVKFGAMKKISFVCLVILAGVLVVNRAKVPDDVRAPAAVEGAAGTERTVGEWAVFRGNGALNGVAQEALAAPLKLAWKSEMTGPVVATAAISSQGTVYIGSQDGDFRAIDLESGDEKWMRELGYTIESSACVLDGNVYVGSGDGFLYALKGETGEELWKYETEGEILGGVNFLKEGDKTYLYVGSYDNFLHCVDAATGDQVWTVETGNYVHGTPAVAEGKVMFGGCDAILYMVDALTGEDRGQIEIGSYISNSVAVKDGLVYTAHYGNQAEAYSIAEKRQVWVHQDRNFPYFASPAVVEDTVLVADRGKRLHALDAKDGSVKWSFRARRSIDSSPVVSGSLVYVGSDDGRLYAVSLDAGEEVWSYEIGDAITAAPAVAGGRLVVGGQDGFVYAFESAQP